MLKLVLSISLLAAGAVGCNSSSSPAQTGTTQAALTGQVANGTGTEVVGFGGDGALASTVTISALTIDATGQTVSIAQGPVSANGTFSINLPAQTGPTLVQGLDAQGNVVVSAILEDAVVADGSAMVQPLTTQSSVEAAVLLAMLKGGATLSSIDLGGLRGQIDATTAQVVHDHAADVLTEAQADVAALAVAAMAVQASAQASLTAAGVSLTSYTEAELAAANTLTAALIASPSTATEANAAFVSTLANIDATLGMSPTAAVAAATAASATAEAAIMSTSTSNDLTTAFGHAQAIIESVATTTSIMTAFTAEGASSTVMAQLQTASTQLTTAVNAATTPDDVAAAFDAWSTAVRGTITGTGGLLATTLGDSVTATAAYTSTVADIVALETQLQASVSGAAAQAKSSAGAIDTTKLAQLVAQAYQTFDTSVQTAITSSSMSLSASQSSLMTSVFTSTQASF